MTRPPDRFPIVALAAGVVLLAGLALSLRVPQGLWALLSPASATHQLDGIAAPGEYQFAWTDDASRMVLRWSIVGDRLIGAVSSPDTGWVAVGFGGSGPLMFGADIVIGWVDATGAHLEDNYAQTPVGHVADTALGGRSDLLGAAGVQHADGTTLEFERPLGARDSTDRSIGAGETHVILASEQSDDPAAYHVGGRKAVALLDLFDGPAAAGAGGVLPDHLTDVQIMVAAWMALLLIIGFHGVASDWAESREDVERAEPSGFAVALLVLLVLFEVVVLGVFAVGVHRMLPVWLLGSALGLGLLALAGIVVVYSRVMVPWKVVRTERDDGVPW